MNSPHYPTKDEMQYMGDLMRGKRKRDLLVILAFTVAGAIFGAVIGFAGHAGESEPLDVGFILSCVGVVALTFAVITGMLLASLRSIVAICKAWIPARVIVGIVCAVVVFRFARSVLFWMLDPSTILMHLVSGAMGLIFCILFLLLGLRLLFSLYCMITGKDDEELTARAIAADDAKKTAKKRQR